MRISIKKVGKKWEVNGKCPNKLQGVEKTFFEEFLVAMKLDYTIENKEVLLTAENYIGEKI